MRRSLVLPSLLALTSGLTLPAQEDRADLQSAAARVDQRRDRIDEYLRKNGQAQNRQDQQATDRDIAQLRELVLTQERAVVNAETARDKAMIEMHKARASVVEAKEALAQEQQRVREVQTSLDEQRRRSEGAAVEARRNLDRARAEAKELRTALEKARAAMPAQAEQQRRLEQELAATKSEVGELRASLHRELTELREVLRTAREEAERLRAENEELRARLAETHARGQAPQAAPPSPGNTGVIVNNERGEVHLHFHGEVPPVEQVQRPVRERRTERVEVERRVRERD